ncbi:PhzF family phenazine biosynthesis protein [Actinoplanes sp. NPDC049316]|uniref:PhzF family phenazine biosynthesis protein n=1 Tax=Actinoplanes sp. NPDC049316 TaxID=3154727 RepID=UPI003431AF59
MRYHIVDAFKDGRFGGNPAAVVVGPDLPGDELLQATAYRIGVPTTAFLTPDGDGQYRVRWFTPYAEVNLCGHATIAGARHLFAQPADADRPRLRFVSAHGVITAERSGDLIALTLPRPALTAAEPPPEVVEALGTPAVACAVSPDDVVIEVASAEAVAAVRPDFPALARLPFRGHIVTAPGTGGDDFVSRTFFPSLGLDEDEVCVTAHAKLAPYWAGRLGRSRFSALQMSPRGGRLEVQDAPDHVRVLGTAVPRAGDHELPLERLGSR